MLSYRDKIEKEIKNAIEQMGEPSRLRDACEYALVNGGKRLRPIIVLIIAEALNLGRDVIPAALAVEFFHTASLIADDLPCMDNDDMRRNKPSLHIAFDESTALLASYTLVAAGYAAIYEESRRLKEQEPLNVSQIDAITVRSLEATTRSAGLRGATHGQVLDLFPPDRALETIITIIEQKTATLFEISFVLGYLFGGGDEQRLNDVKACARHLGVAFQVGDDYQDVLQDNEPKSINIAEVLGLERAGELFEQEMQSFKVGLQSLGLWTQPFQDLCAELEKMVCSPQIYRERFKNRN
jgi:geranylgeranyl diphosphate synthase, type II